MHEEPNSPKFPFRLNYSERKSDPFLTSHVTPFSSNISRDTTDLQRFQLKKCFSVPWRLRKFSHMAGVGESGLASYSCFLFL